MPEIEITLTTGPQGPQGPQGEPGVDGTDGSPDTPDQVAAKLSLATDAVALAAARGALEAETTAQLNTRDTANRNRTNHSGTQLAATISDFAAATAATASVTANTAKVTNATHTGDVTGAGALTIANNAVTNAKAADMAANTIKGRITGSTGDPQDLTAVQAKSVLGLGAVDNTSDANKPVSSATQTALDDKLSLDGSLAMTGNLDMGNTAGSIVWNGQPAIDVGQRSLYDSSGWTVSVDWENRSLYDSGWTVSVDWENHYLADSSGSTNMDWSSSVPVFPNGISLGLETVLTGTATDDRTITFPDADGTVMLETLDGVSASTARTNLLAVGSDPTGVTGADAITNMMSLTQAEYDAITPAASTLYVIV